ncbi:MAG: M23 family metallopeptidase [Lentisphaerae bacterium]|nr:M23 family metallopeptidase [Lentisphaerota bacterium]
MFAIVCLLSGLQGGLAAPADARDASGGGELQATPPAPWTCTSPDAAPAPSAVDVPRRRDGASILRYPFYPLGGNVGEDVFLVNTTDRDPGGGVRDPFCGTRSYDGHSGLDTDYITFAFQDGGVPVFAALDGTVIACHDGEFDRNTTWANQPANYVILDHGGGHQSWYWHLRKDSVAVSTGEVVRAGHQLGLMGSSGISTGPHLHFETRVNGQAVEPFVGDCRTGQSLWVHQDPLDATPYLRDFTLTTNSLSGWGGPPTDTTHDGMLLSGTRTLYFWISLMNMTPGLTYSFRVLRPSGTAEVTQGPTAFSGVYRSSWWWWSRTVNLDQTGTWHLEFSLNGAVKVLAPFDVVASAAGLQNRAPWPVTVSLDATNVAVHAVSICRIRNFTPLDDPDYGLVQYRYRWTVGGLTRRDVTVAARSDVLEQGVAAPGQTISCAVTPTDGQSTASTVTVSAVVHQTFTDWATNYGPGVADAALDGDHDGIPNGIEYLLGSDPGAPSAMGTFAVDPETDEALLELPLAAAVNPADVIVVETTTNLMDATAWEPAKPNAAHRVWAAGQAGDRQRYLRLRATVATGLADTVLVTDVLGLP